LRRPRLSSFGLVLLAVAGVPVPGWAEPVACAVRLAPAAQARLGKSRSLPVLFAALPQPPLEARPLLAVSPATTSTGASSPGPELSHPLNAWQVLRFESAAALQAALPALRAHPDVLEVEPVRSLTLDGAIAQPAAPVAPAAVQSAEDGEIPWNVERVGAPAALALVTPDTTLVVAVIDTGADLSHPDLQRRLWHNDDEPGNASPDDDGRDQNGDGFVEEWEKQDDDDNGYVDDTWGFDFTDAPGQGGFGDATVRDNNPSDQNGHGTHVAGIIAADGKLRGVAPFVRLMPVRAAYNQFFGGALETDDAAAAIVYAVDNGARVLNLSWGDREESSLVRAAIGYAVAHDVIVVAAVGNNGSEAPHFPCGDPRVIGVAASNRSGARASFSNYGAAVGVELAAPGEESAFPGAGIRSLLPLDYDDDGVKDGIGERRGTSMAAPHVAGLAAIVLCRADKPDAVRARALLVAAARRAPGVDWTAALGHGEADGVAAVQSTDDLIVTVQAEEQEQDRFALVGTVLSGDLPRRSLTLMHRPTGEMRTVLAAVPGQVVADTLAAAALGGAPPGLWEYTLAVQTADGRRRERHGVLQLDRTAPVVDTLAVQEGWRAGEPRWLVSVHADEAVRLRVTAVGDSVPLLADAGFSARVQLEEPAVPTAADWIVSVENEAGGRLDLPVPRPPMLSPWPGEADLPGPQGALSLLDLGPFSPETWGMSPAGAVVWGRVEVGSGQTMQAYAVVDDHFVRVYDTGRDGFPRSTADANGDGADDLLFQGLPADGLGITWLVTRSPGGFPDSVAASLRDLRALGFFQLDADPAFEAILARDDALYLYDDAAGRAPALLQRLDNPVQTGFNAWGADAVAGDLDGDGRLEIACGDAEGFVTVFERGIDGIFRPERQIDSGGTYAYDLTALPEGGFLVGSQRTVDPAGDGYPTAVVEFVSHGSTVPGRYPFLALENYLDIGSALALSPSGAVWLALVEGQDLYLARGATEPRGLVLRAPIAAGEAPIVADLDADGRLELVLQFRGFSALYRLQEDIRGPRRLRAESLGPDRLRLTWLQDMPGEVVVRRTPPFSESWVDLGRTTSNTWIDSMLVPFVKYSYRVVAVLGDSVVGESNGVVAQAQPLPRLLAVQVQGPTALRLRASNALHPLSLVPHRFHLQAGEKRLQVQQLTVAEDGRVVDLSLDAPLPCGPFVVQVDSLRDTEWGLLAGPASRIESSHECSAPAFFVVGVGLGSASGALEVEWSREPDDVALANASYDLSWNGAPVPIDRVEHPDPDHTLVFLPAGTPWVGRGIPYLLRIASLVRARADAAPLTAADTVHRIYVAGTGATQVFPVPNPARGSEVVFAEAAADTRIQIYNLEGDLVRELRDPLGGGLHWDLRAADGNPVASGVYVYVARDARGSSRGRLAVLR